ncbi:MAG: class I SAM-dependent methyltransferase [Flavobacteriales bacterium]|nr:class I SAM-dependent methyltransferase [Flavobacteriales bacterium]
MDYLKINKKLWNDKVAVHLNSDFYDNENFIRTKASLNPYELALLGDLRQQHVLHLQCHFGQDSISLAQLGARVTGVDFSDKAIEAARQLADTTRTETVDFICCDVYELPRQLDKQFDVVFTTYGTIGWLPDLTKWAEVIAHFLKPGGQLIFVEFHPFVWMFDEDFKQIRYSYFNKQAIVEEETGTYTDRNAALQNTSISWNHPVSEVVNALINAGLSIRSLSEYDTSPYNCFKNMEQVGIKQYRIAHLADHIPMVYSIVASK